MAAVRSAAQACGYSARDIISGAGHDAAYISRVAPTAMVFVPCKDGISHNEAEFTSKEQCAAGAQVLLQCRARFRSEIGGAQRMSAAADSARAAGGDLFGHPRGLSYLFATEMWERFSYYGMRALLVLYMVKHLLQPERAEQVIGYATLKSGLEFLFGPLGVQPLSSHIYGFYTAFVYLTPVFGGLLADRLLGQRRTVMLGAVLMAIGHFMMAFEPLFLLRAG